MTSMSVTRLQESPTNAARGRVLTITKSPWSWMVITCVLLGISGGIRTWRERQFQTIEREGSACPFPLKELPYVMGNWKAIEGSETQLDPEIARIAGSSDHVIRSYSE